MLLWLDGRPTDAIAEMNDDVLRAAITNLARAVRAGLHVLGGSRAYIRALAESGRLDADVAVTLASCEQGLTQVGRALTEFPKIRVSARQASAERVGDDWLVPLQEFSDARRCERAKVLVENLTDYEIYAAFANSLIEANLPAFQMSVQPLNGGGDTTADVLQYESELGIGRLVCIVDSDRKHATDTAKQTARRCEEIHRSIASRWMYELIVLESRELENLVPAAMRAAACVELEAGQRELLQNFTMLPSEVQAFVCLKKGERLCRFYMSGTLQAADPSSDVPCVHCGRNGGCIDTPVLGAQFLRRLARGLRLKEIEVISIENWSDELKRVVRCVVTNGLGSRIARAA